VKFSKDGKYLAAASRSSQINIYVLPSYKLKSTLKGHHSTVTHLDFSENSNVLMSNCTSYEILFWNLDSGK
jgi:WD40 repeat protein